MRRGNAPEHVAALVKNHYWFDNITDHPAIVKDVWWYWHRDDFWNTLSLRYENL